MTDKSPREVLTYMRRARAVRNPYTGLLNMQRWHVNADGSLGWHGIPFPDKITAPAEKWSTS